MAYQRCEDGYNSDITIAGEYIIKMSREVFATHGDAQRTADEVVGYATLLATEPLQIASLHAIKVVQDADGYRVRHEYDLVDGPSLNRLPSEEVRSSTVGTLIAQIADMSTIKDINTLAVPIDARAENFHAELIDAKTKTPYASPKPWLVDIWPALTRNQDSSFPSQRVGPAYGNMFPTFMGTKSGTIIKLLSSAIGRGDTPLRKIWHTATHIDDWCYDALPDTLHPYIKDTVRREIGMHFIPYLLKTVRHKIHERWEA